MSQEVTPALLPETLYSKSQVFIKRGLRAKNENELEEYQLWASLALELLGKSSLSTVHPALVADPTHYQSLFAACGRSLSPNVKTIAAKTLFERLGHISKKFDLRLQQFCEKLALRRNSEIHSGESPFSGMNIDAWEKEFWYAVQTMLSLQDKDLDEWVGAAGSSIPKQLLIDANRAVQMAVQIRITYSKEDFEKKYKNPTVREDLIAKSHDIRYQEYIDHFNDDIESYELYECPACKSMGILGGVLMDSEFSGYKDENPFIGYMDNMYISEEFYCAICHLHLFGEREINAAKIPEEFNKIEEEELDFSPDYGND